MTVCVRSSTVDLTRVGIDPWSPAVAPPPYSSRSSTSAGSIVTGSLRWSDTRAAAPPSVAVYEEAPNHTVSSGRASSTNTTVSYGPHLPLVTPGGSVPKSNRRPSPVSAIWSAIARMKKSAFFWPATNVTLDGSPSWSASDAPPVYVTTSGIVNGCRGLPLTHKSCRM